MVVAALCLEGKNNYYTHHLLFPFVVAALCLEGKNNDNKVFE